MKTLKFFSIIIFLLSLSVTSTLMAQDLELKPYGFIKGEMVYATKGVYSWGNPNNNYLSAPQIASGLDTAALGFTAQHTRFGLKGSTGEEIKAGGTIELDFHTGGFDANIKPRIRQAYAWVSKGNVEARFGQQWDIFSPINATTNNTNGNMWYAGNRGFRRGQIQMRFTIPAENFKPLLQVALCEATKEAAGLGADNMSAIPMIQSRFSVTTAKNFTVGGSFVYASYEPNPDVDDDEYSTTGLCADFNLPFCPKFALKGEVNYGTNLNNANLFNIAGNGAKDDDRKAMGLWFNINSKLSDKVSSVLGFGMDKNQTDNLADGAIEQNTVFYGDLILPIDHGFSIAIELESITTSVKNADSNSAIVFNVSGKIAF